jgi:outer membrane protein OmpA-like peptidoglycan-associated protein
MARPAARTAATWAALVCLASAGAAAAEPVQIGGFIGPRWFSDDSALGAKETYRTTLETSAAFGPRVARPLFGWLVPEVELPLSSTTTKDLDVSVFWFEPRAHARFLWPMEKLRPFAVLGAGMPVVLSSKRGIYGSQVSWEGYGGIGAQFSPGRALSFRFDLRVGITDGFEAPIAVEVEATVGLFFELDGGETGGRRKARELTPGPLDADGDHIFDRDDRCVERPEDEDGFEDGDGCPDIDNDLDRVLDIADACPSVPESYNGFEDEDGCQDSVPGELAGILGTIEGLLYNSGSTEVPRSAQKALAKIAAVLEKQQSVRVVVVGHTDDREVEVQALEGEAPEETAQRLADALVELGQQRAQAVKEALVELGVPKSRVDALGAGGSDPVSDNEKPRGRLRNRRVELRLYVPAR